MKAIKTLTGGRKTVAKRAVPVTKSGTVVSRIVVPRRVISMTARPTMPPPSRRASWRNIGLALVMAVGLSIVFRSPFRPVNQSTTATSGQILGAATVAPLTVPVTVRSGDQVWRLIAHLQYGTIAEALGQAAAGSSFEYTSRGSSIYLRRFLNLSNDVTGGWQVRVNGVLVADLSLRSLEQGDQIAVERQPL